MKIKSQKGSITIFVLIALLFYTAFLLLMYAANTNKFKTISEKSEILKGIYEKNTSDESINNIYNKKNTEQLIAGIEKISLPAEYQQVAYLESTGTQYIDLATKLSDSNKVDVDYALKDKNKIGAIFGAQANKNGFTINTNVESNSRFGVYSYIAYNDANFKQNADTRYNIVFSKDGFYQDGNKLWNPTANQFETSINAYLFMANGADSVGPMKIYGFKLYDDDILIRNFIPCKNSSNTIGMYDTVTGQFYTNQGTGEFTAGPDVD